jgi:predicted RNA binding protein YcfA (HicA-like mRNA interferase family)
LAEKQDFEGKLKPSRTIAMIRLVIVALGRAMYKQCRIRNVEKLLVNPQNVRFADFCRVIEAFGYRWDRTKGSHHIYQHLLATRPLNVQSYHGQAKPYQIRQFLRDVEEFQLTLAD